MNKEPAKPRLVKKIINELKRNPNGIWVRKLSRNLDEPLATIYKYILRDDYCGKFVVKEKRPKELGGHLIVKLKMKK